MFSSIYNYFSPKLSRRACTSFLLGSVYKMNREQPREEYEVVAVKMWEYNSTGRGQPSYAMRSIEGRI
jgi:hypothetical protein